MPNNDQLNVYALDAGKNSWLTMTKEQILTAITQAVNEGTIGDIDAGFITKLQEMNESDVLQFWVGTMAEFNALTEKSENTLYIFTDDPTIDDIEQAITNVEQSIADIVSGETVVGNASFATSAGSATNAANATNATNASKINGLIISKGSNNYQVTLEGENQVANKPVRLEIFRNLQTGNITLEQTNVNTLITISRSDLINQTNPLFRLRTNCGVVYIQSIDNAGAGSRYSNLIVYLQAVTSTDIRFRVFWFWTTTTADEITIQYQMSQTSASGVVGIADTVVYAIDEVIYE